MACSGIGEDEFTGGAAGLARRAVIAIVMHELCFFVEA